jgi:glycosyltransferase involved in cell wall biosynthesis
MISVLTLTYKRHHLLEEAIQSFILQNKEDCEMVIINDNLNVDYVYNHPNIKIVNHKDRFPSISAKLEWGFTQCKYDYVYRLDDDDLLGPDGLSIAKNNIIKNPNYDVYRSSGMYFFCENNYEGIKSNINNGNIYSKSYLNRIIFPKNSIGEDSNITFGHNAKIYESLENTPTMIYRWGMNTLHISGMGNVSNEEVLKKADEVLDNTTGIIELNPKFMQDYYSKIIL